MKNPQKNESSRYPALEPFDLSVWTLLGSGEPLQRAIDRAALGSAAAVQPEGGHLRASHDAALGATKMAEMIRIEHRIDLVFSF